MIAVESADATYQRCLDIGFNPTGDINNSACQQIFRSPTSGAGGYINRSYNNLGRSDFEGIDVQLNWSHQFAGVCGLEVSAYRAEQVGEIVGLYTITRFKGEGVGGRLIARALDEARRLGMRYVFACTIDDRAQAFFERLGFRSVAPDQVPAAKWVGYERQRRDRLKVMRLDLEPQPA
jgi:amino-acid N-acetyltransferase